MVVLLASSPAAASQRGGAVHDRVDYEYKVTEFDYDISIAMTAAEAQRPRVSPA